MEAAILQQCRPKLQQRQHNQQQQQQQQPQQSQLLPQPSQFQQVHIQQYGRPQPMQQQQPQQQLQQLPQQPFPPHQQLLMQQQQQQQFQHAFPMGIPMGQSLLINGQLRHVQHIYASQPHAVIPMYNGGQLPHFQVAPPPRWMTHTRTPSGTISIRQPGIPLTGVFDGYNRGGMMQPFSINAESVQEFGRSHSQVEPFGPAGAVYPLATASTQKLNEPSTSVCIEFTIIRDNRA